MKARYIIGLDEVGRGALAGPVVVAGVAIPAFLRFRPKVGRKVLRDSKKLSPTVRESWVREVKINPSIAYTLTRAYPRAIDKLNISKAANLAASRACERLLASGKFPSRNVKIYLDGGLFLKNRLISEKLQAKTVVQGDEKINAIKLASIMAKVNRDRYMIRLHKTYPAYGFGEHKGYGTRKHKRAIRKYGPTPSHRLTFV